MPAFSSFKDFGAAVERMEKDIEANTVRIAKEMAEKAQRIASGEANSAIGGSFSGWKRGNPIGLDTKLKTIKNGVVMTPTRTSAGPWTVGEKGRHNGNAGGFSGPGINHKTGATGRTKSGGLRKVGARRGKRWNGSTAGKHIASNAVAAFERQLNPIAERGILKVELRHFDVD